MPNDVNVNFSVSVIRSQDPPATGNLSFSYEAATPLPAGVTVKENGDIDIEAVDKKSKFRISFHMSTTKLDTDTGTYELKFIPQAIDGNPADAAQLLWITKAGAKPKNVWDGGGGFTQFSHAVDGEKSSMSVLVDKSLLPTGAYDYGLAFNLRKSDSAAKGEYVRHDPQIKNGNTFEIPRGPLVILAVGIVLIVVVAYLRRRRSALPKP